MQARPFKAAFGLHRRLPLWLITGAVFAHWVPTAQASELEETVEQLTSKAAAAYISPITDGFGADLNAGWFHRAPKAETFGFHVEAGTVFMGSLLGATEDHFDVRGSFRFSRDDAETLVDFVEDEYQDLPAPARRELRDSLINLILSEENDVAFYGATVTGDEDDHVMAVYGGKTYTVNVPGSGSQEVEVPGDTVDLGFGGILKGAPILPLFAPQITVGTVLGTQVSVRWLPEIELGEEVGKLNYFGIGVQHNPGIIGLNLPVDFAVSGFYQRLAIGDLFEAKGWSVGLNVSKTLGWRFFNLIPYTGIALERSSLSAEYEFEYETPEGMETSQVSFEADGANTWRATFGLSLRLGIFNLNGDYNLGPVPNFSVGLMLGI